jgi:hypothetical protein
LVAFLESFVNNGSKALFSQRSYGGSQLNSLHGTSPLSENMTTLMVVHGQRSYVEALEGEGQSQEFESSCKGKVGLSKDRTLRGTDGCGRREAATLPGGLGIQAGIDSLKVPLAVLSEVLELRSLRNMLVSLKRDVKR